MNLQERIEEAAALAKQGQSEQARELALALVREFPEEADPWALLSQIVDSPDLAAYCLTKVLELSDNGRILGWAEARLAEIDPALVPEDDPFDLYDPGNLLKRDFFQQPAKTPAPQTEISPESQTEWGDIGQLTSGVNPLLLGAIILVLVVVIGVGSLLSVNGLPGPNSGRINIATIPPPQITLTPILPGEQPQGALPPIIVTAEEQPLPTLVEQADSAVAPTIRVLPTPTATPAPTRTPGPPASVQIDAPAQGAVINDIPFSIVWQRAAGAETYAVQLVADDGNVILNLSGETAADICTSRGCQLSNVDVDNGAYTLSIEAINDVGRSSQATSRFVVNSPTNFTFELGGQVPGGIARPELMQSSGMTWVKFQVIYEVTPPDAVRELVEQGRQFGFKVLLSITGETFPDEIDFAGYNAYLAQVAAYQPDAIEVWNEMNLETEWPVGEISPEQYVTEMLAPAYATIKQASPDTLVIIGALASTGVDNKVTVWSDDSYIDGLNDAGAANFADCMGTHHNGGATSPRVQTGHPADRTGHHSWYYLPTLEVAYEGMDEQLPLCITELGYLTPDGYPPLTQDWLWAQDTSVAEQSEWLAEGVRMARELGYVRFVIVWNVDFSRYDIDPQGGFAILRPDNTCPACATLTQAMQP